MIGLWDVKEKLKGFDPRDYEGFLYYVWFPSIDYHYVGVKKFWTKDGELSPWMYYTTSSKDVQRLITEGYEHKQTIIELFSYWDSVSATSAGGRSAIGTEAKLINLLKHKHGKRLLNVSKYPFDSEYKMRTQKLKPSDVSEFSQNDYQALSLYKQAQAPNLCMDEVARMMTKTKAVVGKPLSASRKRLLSEALTLMECRLKEIYEQKEQELKFKVQRENENNLGAPIGNQNAKGNKAKLGKGCSVIRALVERGATKPKASRLVAKFEKANGFKPDADEPKQMLKLFEANELNRVPKDFEFNVV